MGTVRRWGVLGGGLVVLGMVATAEAHPGALDRQGCHAVHVRWQAADGTVFEPKTYHCHRPLGTMKLDERDILQHERRAPGRPHPVPEPAAETP